MPLPVMPGSPMKRNRAAQTAPTLKINSAVDPAATAAHAQAAESHKPDHSHHRKGKKGGDVFYSFLFA